MNCWKNMVERADSVDWASRIAIHYTSVEDSDTIELVRQILISSYVRHVIKKDSEGT